MFKQLIHMVAKLQNLQHKKHSTVQFLRFMKYECNGSRAQLTRHTYFARDLLCSYFYEPQKNEIYFLMKFMKRALVQGPLHV